MFGTRLPQLILKKIKTKFIILFHFLISGLEIKPKKHRWTTMEQLTTELNSTYDIGFNTTGLNQINIEYCVKVEKVFNLLHLLLLHMHLQTHTHTSHTNPCCLLPAKKAAMAAQIWQDLNLTDLPLYSLSPSLNLPYSPSVSYVNIHTHRYLWAHLCVCAFSVLRVVPQGGL